MVLQRLAVSIVINLVNDILYIKTLIFSIFVGFYIHFDIIILSGCVGDDKAKGDGTDQGSCTSGQLCTEAGECLGT